MSSYKIKYEQLRQNPEMSTVLAALERGFDQYNIDYYLIGAVARDVWMIGINKISPRRTTSDIDFAVLINDKGRYEALREYLITKESFQPYKENSFVLIKDSIEIDLLPFGAIEDENCRVMIQGTGFTSIVVPGFKEVYFANLPELELEDGHRFKFSTLPGIVLLKLLAWNDRPESRRDDIRDISDILNHFFKMYDEEIWANHHDLFQDEKAELLHIAAIVMGREMKMIAKQNVNLVTRISTILEDNTSNPNASHICEIMLEYFNNTLEDNILLLRYVKKGFDD